MRLLSQLQQRQSAAAGRLADYITFLGPGTCLYAATPQVAGYSAGGISTCGIAMDEPAGVAKPGVAGCGAAPGKGPAAGWGLDTLHA